MTNFEISSPGIFTPVTSTMKPAVLIARIRRIVIYPVGSAIVKLPISAGEEIKPRVYLRGFYQAFLILTKCVNA